MPLPITNHYALDTATMLTLAQDHDVEGQVAAARELLVDQHLAEQAKPEEAE